MPINLDENKILLFIVDFIVGVKAIFVFIISIFCKKVIGLIDIHGLKDETVPKGFTKGLRNFYTKVKKENVLEDVLMI